MLSVAIVGDRWGLWVWEFGMQALQSHRLVVILLGVGSESFLLSIWDDLDEYHELRQSFTEIRKATPYHGEVRHLSDVNSSNRTPNLPTNFAIGNPSGVHGRHPALVRYKSWLVNNYWNQLESTTN